MLLPLQDQTYDVIVLGTGLTECILSGILAVEGKKVLQMDRNDYYGGDSASLNLTQLYRKFAREDAPPASMGSDRDYHIDLIPKFTMADGELIRILVHTGVHKYLEFVQIAGSYVYRDGQIAKVPSSALEATMSPLLTTIEQVKAKSFFEYIRNYRQDDPSTHDGLDAAVTPMKDVFEKFGLEKGATDFVGHALALHLDDQYLDNPALDTFERIKLYVSSMARYGKSPYIYPRYGLGELPQAFARLGAVNGATYMLDKKVDEIVYENGKAVGVRSGDEVAKCRQVICDPSYASSKVKKVAKVVRAICLLNGPIPGAADADSFQIIIPQKQVDRKNDIYVAGLSAKHKVCEKGYLAIVSTIVETDKPEDEIQPGLQLLGNIVEKFVDVADVCVPIDDGVQDQVFVSKSYDATSHFESVCDNVKELYQRVTGHELVLNKREAQEE
ncbi:Rab GDP dissociation inhibitor alpha [Actinomortierella ambigua]|nr:Rab GDP dissociation inhibitor alpha [Actinomortierella ambigua]